MKSLKKIICAVLSIIMLFCFFCISSAAEETQIRNVIFMIGDGMGYNHLRLAEQEGYTLFMEQGADLAGWSRTRSASSSVTDSAAGATALSCGIRVANRQVCVFPDDTHPGETPRIITENAARHGMHVGIVTSDKTTGATPAAYSAHTSSRDNEKDISSQQLSSGFDLIWGANTSTVTASQAEANGFVYVTNVSGLRALEPGTRSFGQFPSDGWKLSPSKSTPTLEEMTRKSIELLSADAANGFFLMVEGAHIDKISDDTLNNAVDYPSKRADTAEAVKSFDLAVQAAAEFARADGHTMVIVTVDHETGDLYYEENTMEYTFHSSGHTGKNVPVFVYGAADLFAEDAAMDNRDFPNLIAARLGWEERFPVADPVPAEPTKTPDNDTEKPAKQTLWQRIAAFFRKIGDFIRRLFRR